MARQSKMRDEERAHIIEIWKTVVDVQQHFNDISMRIRGMFVTILLALFAAIGFLYTQHIDLKIAAIRVKFALVMPLFGIVGTYLFYFIDRFWYHRLLVGSVNHALNIEEKYKDEIPELSLSEAIGKESPYQPHGVTYCLARIVVRDKRFRDTGRLHSDAKIELFYKSVVLVLVLTIVLLAVFGGIERDTPTASSSGSLFGLFPPFLQHSN